MQDAHKCYGRSKHERLQQQQKEINLPKELSHTTPTTSIENRLITPHDTKF
jgi:hypothetical protein